MYRIAVNGVHCIYQTVDNLFNVDRWGDEIYLTWSVSRVSTSSRVSSGGISKVYGDINRAPSRIKAGDARVNAGGIRDGNVIPYRLGPLPGAPPSFPPMPLPAWSDMPRDAFPMTLWEGELEPNESVTVVPLIWEWDGDGLDPTVTVEAINKIAVEICEAVNPFVPMVGIIRAVVSRVVAVAIQSATGTRNRPIGVDPRHPWTAKNVMWPAMTLGADKLEASRLANTGYGPGIYRYVQTDPGGISAGSYELFLQISKV